jgi:hypothetical protein
MEKPVLSNATRALIRRAKLEGPILDYKAAAEVCAEICGFSSGELLIPDVLGWLIKAVAEVKKTPQFESGDPDPARWVYEMTKFLLQSDERSFTEPDRLIAERVVRWCWLQLRLCRVDWCYDQICLSPQNRPDAASK